MSRYSRSPLAVAAALALVAVLASCGGEDGRAGTSTSTSIGSSAVGYREGRQLAKAPATAETTDPVRRAYIARVDAVCKRLDGDRQAALERAGEGADTEQGARAYDDTISLGERQLREIEAIPTPPGEGRLLRSNVFDLLHHQLEIRRQMEVALADEDIPRLARLRSQLDSLTQALLGFARGYGFKVCGED